MTKKNSIFLESEVILTIKVEPSNKNIRRLLRAKF